MWGRKRPVDLVDTEEMDALFARLDRMNQAQFLAMRAAWRSTSRQAHEDAWASVRAIGARDGLTKEIDRVRDKALGWASRGTHVVPLVRGTTDITWLQVKGEAEEAIVDVALAVALGGRLDAQSRDVLMGPWERATEASD